MKLPWLLTVFACAVFTDLFLAPVWQQGLATPDVTALLILWLAHRDSRRRVYLLVALITVLRCGWGIASVWQVALPLAVAVELAQSLRGRLNLRDPYVRSVMACGGLLAHQVVLRLLHEGSWSWWLPFQLLPALLVLVLFFPFVDLLAPLLRSYRHPM